ncbi:MAG: N-6 DNA methylase [Fimbriimonadaceae bacterium]|nr:N-6 DNA methylase [Fimbriimonadaceae bacterium]
MKPEAQEASKLTHAVVREPKPHIKSRERVQAHGEVFTPEWLVQDMLNLVKDETERIDSRFLEPACGSGNFLVPVLKRKLAAVELKYGKNEFEKRQYALLALMCIYGIELLADNIAECRANLLEVFAAYLGLEPEDDLFRAASFVLSINLVHGDAMTMKLVQKGPATTILDEREDIWFAEWGYLGKGKFQRRDFRLDGLSLASAYSKEMSARESGSLFADAGKHELFRPIKTHEPISIAGLAALDTATSVVEAS